jgi:hypothetical protein
MEDVEDEGTEDELEPFDEPEPDIDRARPQKSKTHKSKQVTRDNRE